MELAQFQQTEVAGYAQEKASFDIQIATAKKYPRTIQLILQNAIATVTMDKDTAEICNYSLPRGGKPISGPSVHLARILAAEWGNLRIESKIVDITGTEIVAEAVCFDLEKNYAVKTQVRRKITGKDGQRFKDDMVNVTGAAASSIAFRNAVFNVIPKAIVDKIYNESKRFAIGDLSNESKLAQSVAKTKEFFLTTYGASDEDLLHFLGLRNILQIKADQISILRGLATSLKEGATTAKEAFGWDSEKPKGKDATQPDGSPKQTTPPVAQAQPEPVKAATEEPTEDDYKEAGF